MRYVSEGQTILHQVADQARNRDPLTRLTVKDKASEDTDATINIISLADGRDNEIILTGAKHGRAKVSFTFKSQAVILINFIF